MIDESPNKPNSLESEVSNSILSKFGSLYFGSLFKPLANQTPKVAQNASPFNKYSKTKSFLDGSVLISKERYKFSSSSQASIEYKTKAKLEINKPGNYIIIFYSKTDKSNHFKTLNKLYEITYKELAASNPFIVDLNKDFFNEGQKLMYQKFGSDAEGFAKDFSKVAVARIYNGEVKTEEEIFPTKIIEKPLSLTSDLLQ